MVSTELRAAVKLSRLRQYQIAARAGMNPSMLSRLINGIERVRPGDPRVLRVAAIVGVPPERAFAFRTKTISVLDEEAGEA